MRVKLASLAALAAATALQTNTTDAAAQCPVTADMLASAAYLSCQKATGAILESKAASVSVSPSVFCSNRDCYAVWNTLSGAKQLRCYQQYSVGSYSLKGDDGINCFNDYGGSSTTPSTPSPASPPAPPVTAAPASPTVAPTPATKAPSTPSNSDTGTTTTKTDTPSTNSGTTPSTGSNSSPSNGITTTAKPTTDGSVATGTTGGSTGTTGDATGTTGGTSETSGTDAGDNKGSTTSGGGASGDEGSQANASSSRKNPSSSSASMSETATTGGTNKSNGTSGGSQNAPGGSSNKRDDSTDTGSSRVWVVSGSSVGGILVVGFIFVYVRRRRDSSINAMKLDVVDGAGYLPTLQDSHSRRSGNDSFAVMGDARYAGGGMTVLSSRFAFGEDEVIAAARIPLEKLKRGVLISRGGYGEVYRGTYRDEVVAIKTLLPARRNDMRQIENFLAEVKIMAALEHEHIVRFIGVAWDALNELCVVSEFLERGDLRTLLSDFAAKPRRFPKGFGNADKTKIALHVAHALTYMHSLQPMVLHRDLKSRNILLDNNLNAKITDFGVSRERADSTMTIGVGSSLWMAPEVMTGGRYDEKADVFSFGVVLSELDTHALPYSHALEPGTGRKLPDTVVVQMMTTGRITVEFTDDESPMTQLGRRCVLLDPKERPSAAEVQHQIHQMSRGITASR